MKESKELTDRLARSTNYHLEYTKSDVWRQWLSARTQFGYQGKPYSWFQTAYHYSKDQRYLEGEIRRFESGNFELDYDWIDRFNADCMNFRKDEF